MAGFSIGPTPLDVGTGIKPSTTSRAVDTGERATSDTTYVKMVAFKVPYDVIGGLATVRFAMRPLATDTTTYGRIYKNGVAIGTERSNNASSYQTYDEDLDIGSAGDEIELYMKMSAGGSYVYENRLEILFDRRNTLAEWKLTYP